ncbi:MAG: leucine-rich repeat domain-containing protein, partial [Alistipes sp.]|nr:leucine-rich repeat domain-containing protein [Alistipes sp.]
SGASVINGAIEVNAGTFSGRIENYYGTPVLKGGNYSVKPNANFIAAGYKAVEIGDLYYVLPEVIADAAVAANVTAVTESTADVATALANNNGEVTMFMWNDVAYIAKYGEVVITSAADEATTVRGVVESAAGLTSATVAEGVEVVGNRTFRKCANLETVALPNTLTEIGPAVFQSCPKLANVTIPASVTTIGEGAFAECTSLTSINIPEGITRLEKDVLRNTGLVSIEIPASVNYIGTYAFRDCESLTSVIINSPDFTIENNSFTNMAAPVPTMTIYVVNDEMKAYLESVLTSYDKSYITVVAPAAVSNAEQLTDALANGENVTLTQDIETVAATTAPYGNKYGFKLDGGVLDGNGHELNMECYGDDYGIMTSGGTIKNLTITKGCRAVMIMYPQQDIILDNVKIGGDGVLYPINTGEAGADGVDLIVTNSVLAGWTSYGLIASASFTNVEFKQGTYYNNIYGRVLKPYVNTTLTNCSFVKSMNLDLSKLYSGHKITFKNCTVDGQAINAGVFTVPTTNAQYDTELFTVDLPSWATSINDCIVFE